MRKHYREPTSIIRPTWKSTLGRLWSVIARIHSWRAWSKVLPNKMSSFRAGRPVTAESTLCGESPTTGEHFLWSLAQSTIYTSLMDIIAWRLLMRTTYLAIGLKKKICGFRLYWSPAMISSCTHSIEWSKIFLRMSTFGQSSARYNRYKSLIWRTFVKTASISSKSSLSLK